MANQTGRILQRTGSKWKVADKMVDLFPPNKYILSYIEPFFGSGSIYFTFYQDRSYRKGALLNDLDDNIHNLFKVIREKHLDLEYVCKWTEWGRLEYEECFPVKAEDPVEWARRFIVRSWMGYNGRSIDKKFGGMGGFDQNSRDNSITPNRGVFLERIEKWHEALTYATLEHIDFYKIAESYGEKTDCLWFLDPPYMEEVRNGGGREMYIHDDASDKGWHEKFLNTILGFKGMVAVTSYDVPLYNEMLVGWEKFTFKTHARGSCTGKKVATRYETMWINPLWQSYIPEKMEQHAKQMSLDTYMGDMSFE